MSRKLGSAFDHFEDDDNQKNKTAADASNELFGVEAVFGTQRPPRVKLLDIFSLWPDPTQPRRAIPALVRRHWDGQSQTLPALLEAWQRAAAAERGAPLEIRAYIEAEPTDRAPDDPESDTDDERAPSKQPITDALLAVVDLAASVYRDGLTNPISVVKRGQGYQVETGERRWLAYHLLHATYPNGDYSKIPARVMDGFSVWRQASENNARRDLNAISRARQLALLLMNLYGDEQFQPIDAFEHEQDFYAQVSDGRKWRTPRGKGESIINAMGLANTQQIKDYRALLGLPRDAWELADMHNLSEYMLRRARHAAREDDDITGLLYGYMVSADTVADVVADAGSGGDTVSTDTVSDDKTAKNQKPLTLVQQVERRGIQQRILIERAIKNTRSKKNRAEMRAFLEEQIAWLQRIKDQL